MEKHITKQEMYYCFGKHTPIAKCLIAVLLLSVGGTLSAQSAKRQLRASYTAAQDEFYNDSYAAAWQLYRRVLAADARYKKAPVNAAVAATRLNYPADSLALLAPSLSGSKSHDALFYLAMISHQNKKFDQALEYLKQYGQIKPGRRMHNNEEIEHLADHCRNAKELLANPTQAKIRNMGARINSPYGDYVPVIMPDESAMYFTSRRENPTHPLRNADNTFFEDVYVSKNVNGEWSQAESAGFPINTETNDACVALSPDGQRMIVYRTAEDIVSGDLYITRLGRNGRWMPLQKLGDEINSPYVETSACFSNDSSEIFFSSDRPGGMGGKDLYRIKKLPNGNWSVPMNLGPAVNTRYNDDAPFLHPDGITLYFSSEGHNSMGGFDVFRSTWNKETNKFSEAENLGFPINDVGNDIFFVLSVDGQRGYYSSAREDNLGATDIYEIDTRFGANDLQVKTGRVVVGLEYGRAQVTLTEQETGMLNGHYFSHPDTGKFILVVNPHKTYEAVIEADGHETIETTIEPQAFKDNVPLKFVLKKSLAQ